MTSALTYRILTAVDDRHPPVLLLQSHPEGKDGLPEQIREWGMLGEITCVLAPRGRYRGIYRMEIEWFVAHGTEPELSTLGDALYHLEQLVLDLFPGRMPLLIGEGQGGTLALASAAYLFDRVAGVIALNGLLPVTDQLPLPGPDLQSLPILTSGPDAERASADAARLDARGACVTRLRAGDAPITVATIIGGWYAAAIDRYALYRPSPCDSIRKRTIVDPAGDGRG